MRAVARIFMSGLLPSRARVYDNAAEFAADIPTFAHALGRAATVRSSRARCTSADPISFTDSKSG